MMMMGEGVSVPPWSHHVPVSGVDVGGVGDEMTPYLLAALRQYLPCNDAAGAEADDEAAAADAAAMAAGVDGYGCDEFRMYEFKVRRCARARSHDWTECPFAHPGEKARRRDPRKYHYSGTACPDFRKGGCKRGDNCDLAHGVFECWLHPARYRTQPCKDGTGCRRRVCFFAHTPDQLRVLPTTQHQQSSPRGAACSPLAESYDGSPLRRQAFESYLTTKSIVSSSPTSTLMSPPKSPPSESPPLSPDGAAAFRRGSWPGVGSPVNDVVATLRQLRLSKANSSPSGGWGGYPACAVAYGSHTAGGLYSLPSTPRATPTTLATASGYMANLEPLDVSFGGDEEPVERVESGRALRAKVFERLSREGVVSGDATAGIGGPDVGWVSDLIN